jgi:AraC family transcriptional regulator
MRPEEQLKAATGLPPHQYVIARRVERVRQLLQAGTDLSLAEVAACAGFSDQSQLTYHFKCLVGRFDGEGLLAILPEVVRLRA